MKSNKILSISLCALASALTLISCSDGAKISGKLEGASDKEIVVKQLNVNTYSVLDTIKTRGDGSFSYKLEVKSGQPEFVYLFYGDTRVAALLLEKGEKVSVKADTLGTFSVEGSEGSKLLGEVDREQADFRAKMTSVLGDGPAMGKAYVSHYRNSIKYLLSHPYSMTVIPVLYEQISEVSPVFSRSTDAIFFRNAADSLMTVYPESRYVKALQKEAERRMRILELETRLQSTETSSFPDIILSDMSGEKKSLSSVDAKAILVHFWDASDAAQKIMNIETLLPIYNEFHSKGFEIYAIGVGGDKADWGATVTAQKLPWINVSGSQADLGSAVRTYNVTSLPNTLLIVNGEISNVKIKGAEGLRSELGKVFRR